MIGRSSFAAAAALTFSMCAAAAEKNQGMERDKLCSWMGGYEEKVCEVPLHRVISNPDDFDGRIIRVTGFFADGQAPLLFAGKDAYETSNTVDSVQLKVSGGEVAKSLIAKNRSFVIVIGRYRAADRLLSTGNESSVLVGGSITVDAAGSALGPWGFQTPPPSLIKKSIGD